MPLNTTWSVSTTLSTEADFRTWWKSWRTALTAVGMVRADDDGTDPDSTLPTLSPVYGSGANREITWEVWRFPTTGDSVQSTSPIFLRFGYGQGASPSSPRLQIRVGTGAGTGGAITPTGGIGGLGDATVVTLSSGGSHWMACDDNGLAVVAGTTGNSRVVVVDRLRNPVTGLPALTAANVSTGVALAALNTNGGTTIASILRVFDPTENYADTASNTFAPCITSPGLMSLVANSPNGNGQTQLYPWWLVSKNGAGALKMIATYNRPELGGIGSVVTASWMPASDATRSVKLLADWGSGGFNASGDTAASAAIWWAD